MPESYQTDLACPGCGHGMYSNGHTMYCETEGCAFNIFKPSGEPEDDAPGLQFLPPDERERIYREGVDDYRVGKQFHESPYASSLSAVSDADYQRGYEWRRGWNDAAIGRVAKP